MIFATPLTFTAHPAHCTPLDADAPYWRQSRIAGTTALLPAALCALLGERHYMVALGEREDAVTRYEYSPRHQTLLIDYVGPARVLRFVSECRATGYTQSCVIEIRRGARTETRSWLFLIFTALADTALLASYAGLFLFACWYTVAR